ncbi:hypothetical protein T4D_16558, partial [Trichinella pseudospiralis]
MGINRFGKQFEKYNETTRDFPICILLEIFLEN